MSIDQILDTDFKDLEKIIFKLKIDSEEKEESATFVQLKLRTYDKSGKKMKLMQIIDVTDYIMYTEIKAKNQFTTLINACVSHELRNPLNSIISKNIEKSALYQ